VDYALLQAGKNGPDPYKWDKFIYRLVKCGYGTYQDAALADIVDAVIFLLIPDGVEARVEAWLRKK
jgi:hypothetical protein